MTVSRLTLTILFWSPETRLLCYVFSYVSTLNNSHKTSTKDGRSCSPPDRRSTARVCQGQRRWSGRVFIATWKTFHSVMVDVKNLGFLWISFSGGHPKLTHFPQALSELSFFLEWIMRWGKICWGTFHFWASRHIEADGTGWPADHLMQWVDPVDASLLPRNLEAELCDKASLSPATELRNAVLPWTVLQFRGGFSMFF